MMFNSWDWNVDTYNDAEDTLHLIFNETKTAVYEDLIKDKIKRRTKKEKASLLIRRIILISINTLLIIIGVGMIFTANLLSSDLANKVSNSILRSVIRQLPTLVVTFVNGFIPAVTKKITKAEKYDFANTLLKQQIWRNFSTRILNLVIYLILNYEMAFNRSYFRSKSVISFDNKLFD